VTKLDTEQYTKIATEIAALEDSIRPERSTALRQEGVEAIATAALAGEPLPEPRLNRPAVSLKIDGLTHALTLIVRGAAEGIADTPEEIDALINRVGLPDSGAELVADLEQLLSDHRTGKQRNQERKDVKQKYDAALERFGELKREYLQEHPLGNGDEASHLLNASHWAKREMGAQANDLAPYGLPGDINVRGGQVLGRTTITPDGVEA
jgi:hypothetical protein